MKDVGALKGAGGFIDVGGMNDIGGMNEAARRSGSCAWTLSVARRTLVGWAMFGRPNERGGLNGVGGLNDELEERRERGGERP